MPMQLPMPGKVFTFGYGSNMCLGRMRCRVPSACPIAVAELLRYRFAFHKMSNSRYGPPSGKGDAFYTSDPADKVLGVVFEIGKNHQDWLDEAEGVGEGYEVQDLAVDEVAGNRRFKARTYIAMADFIDPNLKPFSWYKRHVVQGARHFDLDRMYIAQVDEFEPIEDTVAWRTKREIAYPCDSDVKLADWKRQRCKDSGPKACG
jgi:gamma-glutamylcyclotransferase